jgi:Squalene cyclase
MQRGLFKHKLVHIVQFKDFGNKQNVLEIISQSKKELIQGLRSVENLAGWNDPTGESAESLWTCIEVCKSLVEASEPIINLNGVLKKLNERMIHQYGITGWASDSIPGFVSTYLTSDIGLLYQALGRYQELQAILNSLVKMQNHDGGWGVCYGDPVSKTRATSFVIKLFAKCLDSPWAFQLLDLRSYIRAIEWLSRASNDGGGWGNLADLQPSDISATSWALIALLASKIALRKHPELALPFKEKNIISGIEQLISSGKEGTWRGESDDFPVKLTKKCKDNTVYRYTTSGVGTLVVLQVLCQAVRLDYLRPDNEVVIVGLNDILLRCKSYPRMGGKWIVPSDINGAPTAWNTAFALDAFLEFQRLYLECHSKGIVDIGLTKIILIRERVWQSVAIILFFILLLFIFILSNPQNYLFNKYLQWFDGQSTWTQGILVTLIGAIWGGIISYLISWFFSKKDNKKKGG